jgi:cupin superfamily acireductone dioxygenase involved in methionine salvage
LVKPLNDQVKAINDYAKSISAPIDQVESHLKRELVSFERILEQQRAEQARKAEEERKAKEAEANRIAEEKKQEIYDIINIWH